MSQSELEELLAFQMRAAGLPEPEREYRFHEKRRYRADFAWPDHRLLVEGEGVHPYLKPCNLSFVMPS